MGGEGFRMKRLGTGRGVWAESILPRFCCPFCRGCRLRGESKQTREGGERGEWMYAEMVVQRLWFEVETGVSRNLGEQQCTQGRGYKQSKERKWA